MCTLFLGNDGRLQWETLLTGIAALVAAWLTVRRVGDQIRQAEQLAADQRRRRERAARALLPLALSELADYAKACMVSLNALRPCFQPDGSLDQLQANKIGSTWTTPNLPVNVLSMFKECIEFADDEPAEALATLIRHYQMQHFRLDEDASRLHLNDGVHLLLWGNIKQAIRDAAELFARASTLFPFARGMPTQQFSVGLSDIKTALSLAGCFDLPEIDATAEDWQQESQFNEGLRRKSAERS